MDKEKIKNIVLSSISPIMALSSNANVEKDLLFKAEKITTKKPSSFIL